MSKERMEVAARAVVASQQPTCEQGLTVLLPACPGSFSHVASATLLGNAGS